MYCLRVLILFNRNYIVYYNAYCYYCGVFMKSMCVPSFIVVGSVSELHVCPYHNVWPEAV